MLVGAGPRLAKQPPAAADRPDIIHWPERRGDEIGEGRGGTSQQTIVVVVGPSPHSPHALISHARSLACRSTMFAADLVFKDWQSGEQEREEEVQVRGREGKMNNRG